MCCMADTHMTRTQNSGRVPGYLKAEKRLRLCRGLCKGCTWPSGRGGVAMTMVLQPAICAGTAIMSVLLGRTAVPPGTYRPTEPAPQGNLLTSMPC